MEAAFNAKPDTAVACVRPRQGATDNKPMQQQISRQYRSPDWYWPSPPQNDSHTLISTPKIHLDAVLDTAVAFVSENPQATNLESNTAFLDLIDTSGRSIISAQFDIDYSCTVKPQLIVRQKYPTFYLEIRAIWREDQPRDFKALLDEQRH